MKYFSITIYIRGRKKVMRGVRAFPTVYSIDEARDAMAEMLTYYYFSKDILRIDVVPVQENKIEELQDSNKNLAHVCS